MKELLASLYKEKKALLSYLNSKVLAEDWHAVADAAMDLREIEAQVKILMRLEAIS